MGAFEKDDLETILPDELVSLAVRHYNELVFPFDDAKRVVSLASQNLIAVLGIEAFRFLDSGLGVETYSGYEFQFDGDWVGFVKFNNAAAILFCDQNRLGQGYGYILTATSEDEFKRLRKDTGL